MLLDISAARKSKQIALPACGYRKFRALPDGRTEIETKRGRQYCYVFECSACGQEALSFQSRTTCKTCDQGKTRQHLSRWLPKTKQTANLNSSDSFDERVLAVRSESL